MADRESFPPTRGYMSLLQSEQSTGDVVSMQPCHLEHEAALTANLLAPDWDMEPLIATTMGVDSNMY